MSRRLDGHENASLTPSQSEIAPVHTLAQPQPGVILSITSAIKPRPKHINALWGLLKDTNPGLSRSIRDHSTGFWFSGMKLTGTQDIDNEE